MLSFLSAAKWGLWENEIRGRGGEWTINSLKRCAKLLIFFTTSTSTSNDVSLRRWRRRSFHFARIKMVRKGDLKLFQTSHGGFKIFFASTHFVFHGDVGLEGDQCYKMEFCRLQHSSPKVTKYLCDIMGWFPSPKLNLFANLLHFPNESWCTFSAMLLMFQIKR